MISREVELETSFKLRKAVLEYAETKDIKTDFSVRYNHKLEKIGLGGISISVGGRVI